MRHKSCRRQKQQGFTLLEVTIVLVVLGLLAGGIFAGVALSRSYEIKALVEEKETYVIAVGLFKQKYNALPGDFTEATRIWGQHTSCGGTDSNSKATCNGDGNGYIDEPLYVWNHLGNGGFVNNNYTLYTPSSTATYGDIYRITQNVPASADESAAWILSYTGMAGDVNNPGLFEGAYGHTLILGNLGSETLAVLTPTDLVTLDEKLDDGMPATGKLSVPQGSVPGTTPPLYNPQCTQTDGGSFPTASDDLDARYAAAGDFGNNIACTPIFKDLF